MSCGDDTNAGPPTNDSGQSPTEELRPASGHQAPPAPAAPADTAQRPDAPAAPRTDRPAAAPNLNPQPGAPPPTPPTPPTGHPEHEEQQGPPSPARSFIDGLLGGWRTVVTSAGAVAAALVTYELAKEIGDGKPTPGGHDELWVVLSLAAFAVGTGLLLTIPTRLLAANRATLAEAVEQQRTLKVRAQRRHGQGPDSPYPRLVGREVLLGHQDVIEFEAALVEALAEARAVQEAGLPRPPSLDARLRSYIAQRHQAQLHITAAQVKRSARSAGRAAFAGILLAVLGYANATYITNQAQERADVDGVYRTAAIQGMTDERAARIDQEGKVLDHVLAQRAKLVDQALATQRTPVVPGVPSAVTVVLPDPTQAPEVFADAPEATAPECWAAPRPGQAFDVVLTGQGEDVALGVMVLLERSSEACPAAVVTVPIDLLRDPAEPPTTTTTTAPAGDGG